VGLFVGVEGFEADVLRTDLIVTDRGDPILGISPPEDGVLIHPHVLDDDVVIFVLGDLPDGDVVDVEDLADEDAIAINPKRVLDPLDEKDDLLERLGQEPEPQTSHQATRQDA